MPALTLAALDSSAAPVTMERVFSERVARALRAITPIYDGIAGWAGVALPIETGRDPLAWFVGYTPVQEPQVAIAVVIEDTQDRRAALSVARHTLATLLP